jgi:bifunctional UDP-N-acetylglucosamine pyrophosphorylase/glucosamine-1-phosphate N-acetyltransferase
MTNLNSEKNIKDLIRRGVNFANPETVEVRGELICGSNVSIESNVIFEGKCKLGDNVVIEPYVIIRDSSVKTNSIIKSFSSLEKSRIGSNTFIGPQARIRPSSLIGDDCQIGNFVEVKDSRLGNYCRVNHMAFIGNAEIAEEVTIGAGVITCNHDGVKTNKTVIMKGAYIGSNVNLVAPVTIYEDSVIGSGSTITEDVPAKKLTVARVRQKVIESWKGFSK